MAASAIVAFRSAKGTLDPYSFRGAKGNTDYEAIDKALHEVGFQGLAVIELAHEKNFKPTRPIRESLKISREFVCKVLRY
jgi:hypothetical protein